MGIFRKYQLDIASKSSITPRYASKPSDLPIGQFKSYFPDELCTPGFDVPDECIEQIVDAEDYLKSFDRKYGSLSSVLGWVLQRSESLGSSTIEGVSPSIRRVARAEAVSQIGESPKDSVAMEAVGNIKANELALKIGDRGNPIAVEDVLKIHKQLMQNTDMPEIGGHLRQDWVHIGGVLGGYPAPSYIPPPPEEVPRLLDDWLYYVNNSTHPPSVVASIAHAQFENIHPFRDGNGRTGRAIIQTILRSRGLTIQAICPISSILSLHKNAYIACLASSHYEGLPGSIDQSNSFEGIVGLFSDLIPDACLHGERIIARADAVIRDWRSDTSKIRSDSLIHTMTNVLLPSLPVFSPEEVEKRFNVSARSVGRALSRLQDLGIVRPVRGEYKDYDLYEATDLLDLFDVHYSVSDPTISSDYLSNRFSGILKAVPEWDLTNRQCCHIGAKSKKRCILMLNHKGHHEYQKR